MARGADAKAARKARKKEAKEARAKEAERILAGGEDLNEFAGPLDPGYVNNDGEDDDDSSSDEEEGDGDDDVVPEKTPEKSKSKSKSARAKKAAAARTAAAKTRGGGGGGDASCCGPAPSSGGGIKTLPLIMLIMLTGTTVLPALLYMSDYLGAWAQKKHLLGNLGHKLGIGPSPKKRVISFYEKHDPEKLNEVDHILSKYYGEYPKLTKRLERKYSDYGYFLNWEDDENPMKLAFEKVWETRDTLSKEFDRYAPAIVKTGMRNIRHNLTFVYKKVRKAWMKQVWPTLQPYLGVPDAKTARQQKLKDKRDAEKRKNEASGGGRRKSAEFRDDDDHDEM